MIQDPVDNFSGVTHAFTLLLGMIVGGIIGTITMHFIHLNKKVSYNTEQTVKGIQSIPSKDINESSVSKIQLEETQAKV